MPKRPANRVHVVLCEDEGLGHLSVPIEAFFDLSFWLAEELEDLVANYVLRHPGSKGPTEGMSNVEQEMRRVEVRRR